MTTLESDLEALHSRLSGVTVTCLDFVEFILRVDRPNVLFFLDPPYWGSEGEYGKHLFGRGRFEAMAEVLGSLKGRFILSLNDVPEVRSIFGQFEIQEVKTTYSIGSRGALPDRAELIIRGGNFQR